MWTFRLTLQDATASVAARVYSTDGDTFFTVEQVLLLSASSVVSL